MYHVLKEHVSRKNFHYGRLPRCAARSDCEHPKHVPFDPWMPITGNDRRWTSLESTRKSCDREIEHGSCRFRPEIEVIMNTRETNGNNFQLQSYRCKMNFTISEKFNYLFYTFLSLLDAVFVHSIRDIDAPRKRQSGNSTPQNGRRPDTCRRC